MNYPDYRADYLETDEDNNVAVWPISIEATLQVDDNFYMSHVTSNKTQVIAGQDVKLACRQYYEGASSSTIRVNMNYYLSTDEVVDANDIVLASDVSTLKISDLWDGERATVTIPANTANGEYKLLFWSDSPQAFTEPDELDNLKILDLTVGEPLVFMKTLDHPLNDDTMEQNEISAISKAVEIENTQRPNTQNTVLDFQAYPNPSIGNMTISSKSIPGITSACQLTIIDYNGRIVYESIYKIGTTQTLDLSSINASGVFHLLIKNDTGMIHEQRLMLMR